MLTIKLVVIGASGVGKTSLRGQFISGRFSTGYRATIGADFITKVLPHPSKPDESVTLQIWDTAGQERFSSLSSAFFRGADAALLMFDVNNQETLYALEKWWSEFRDKAPLPDELMDEYCCVVVGNKMDLVSKSSGPPTLRFEIETFVQNLISSSSTSLTQSTPVSSPEIANQSALHHEDFDAIDADDEDEELGAADNAQSPSHRTPSITILPHPRSPSRDSSPIQLDSRHSPSHPYTPFKSRSRSSSRFYSSGTVTTTHTSLTIYHTPSSSLSDNDNFHSARSSPAPWFGYGSSPRSQRPSRRLTSFSNASASSDSTVTPSVFAGRRSRHTGNDSESSSDALVMSAASTAATTPESYSSDVMVTAARVRAAAAVPAPPDRGAKLFFTSAKTGEGVRDVFEYIAARVIKKWEYDEMVESRRMSMRDPSLPFERDEETVQVGGGSQAITLSPRSCCGS